LDVAERIRERAEMLSLPWTPEPLRCTVSVGVAHLRPAHESVQALFDDAADAVQAAREVGGNCVRAAPVERLQARNAGLASDRPGA
jgi:PleD family two-component response regulator